MRFGYTGQAWISELGLWHYKARMYSPELGRFLQTDPVGYVDQLNLYAYVGNDPTNHRDPTGMILDLIVDIGFIAYDIYELVENPSWTNAGALGADIVGAAVPFATGLGAGVRGAAKGAEKIAADSARAANTARGRANEARKLQEIRATRNTAKTATSTGDRIRDGTKADGTHVEVKDTKKLSNTAQLKGLDEAAGKAGVRLEVHTGKDTKVSGNVNTDTLPNTRVIRCTDLGPQCK